MKESDIIYAFFVAIPAKELTMKQLTALARPFRISDTSIRTSLSRMHSKNIIHIRKEGRKAFYRIGEKGNQIGNNVSLHFSDPDWSGWDGSYWGAAFSTPDTGTRYRLQRKLSAYRFGILYPGFWIRPLNPAEKIETALAGYIKQNRLDLFRCVFTSKISPDRIASLYNLKETGRKIHQAYKLQELSMAKNEQLSSPDAFKEYIELGDYLVKILFTDPLLPEELLPPNWPGRELRKLFHDWISAYKNQIEPFIRSCL
jgi:phenylacetic acid degradation operon negative regulatory protein